MSALIYGGKDEVILIKNLLGSKKNLLNINNDDNSFEIDIDNKYFNAQVKFNCSHLSNLDQESAKLDILDCLILIAPTQDKENQDLKVNFIKFAILYYYFFLTICIFQYNIIEKFSIHIEDKGSIEDIPVRILLSPQRSNQSAKETYINWSLDNGFEYIEIDPENIHIGWEDREKEGFPRFIEALESHMWSNLQRKGILIYIYYIII